MTKITKEYRTLIRRTADLELGVKMHLITLGAELVSKELITPEQYEETRNRLKPLDERAANLIYFVQVKVRQDPEYFYVFVDILEDINKYVYENPKLISMLLVIMAAVCTYHAPPPPKKKNYIYIYTYV
jgi:hypothetical protein